MRRAGRTTGVRFGSIFSFPRLSLSDDCVLHPGPPKGRPVDKLAGRLGFINSRLPWPKTRIPNMGICIQRRYCARSSIILNGIQVFI